MGRTTSVLLAALAVVITASLLVFVSGNSEETGIVPGPVVEGTVVGTSAGSSISSTSEGGYTPMPEGANYVRVWDLGIKYTYKHYWPTQQWANRANWTQVPYGEEESYEFSGDCMLEGPNFWLSLHSSTNDACFLYNKVDQEGTPSRHNEMYRSYDGPGGLRTYCSGYEYNKIIKNESGDIIVESATEVRYRDSYPTFPVQIINRYRVQAGKPWLEIEPIAMASEQGMHGESRIHISPDSLPGEQDFLADSWNSPPDQSVYHPLDTSRMLLDLIMDDDCIWSMMWKTTGKIPGINHPFYYTRSRSDNATGGHPAGWQYIGEGISPVIFTAPFAKYREEKMIIGVHRIGYWHYQKIGATVTAGQNYNGQFVYAYQRQVTNSPFSTGGPWWPMYPGKWRMIGRINGQNYTQQITVTEADVGQSNFSFNCPVTGTLEYIVFYLYDRTDQTPPDLYTVMDIYRGGVLDMTAEPVGRHVFYNNSSFDGNNPAAGAADDDAIATDKTALLPGLTATFANYTSYNRGINGIMVDIPDLPTAPEITASDFTFKVGNPPPVQTVLDVNFDIGTDGFGYVDDTFRGTSNPAYADGERIASGGHSGGALQVAVGGIDMVSITNGMSGGWSRSFTLAAESNVTMSLWYKLTQTNAYEPDEYSEALVSIDGQLFGTDGDRLVRITGDGEYGDPITTGWVHVELNLGTLSAGSHTLRIGAYNNKKDHYLESTEMIIDDVKMSADPLPPIQTLLDVNFDSGTDGFGYADDTFRSTSNPAYADGERIASGGHSGGALRVAMGGIDMVSVNGMSGGWGRSFTLAAESNVSLSLWYNLTQTNAYEPDEYSDALVSVDGQLFGTDGNDYVVRITGDGEYGDPITTGWVHAEVSLGVLSAGSHTLKIGAYNNKKNHYLEATEMIIDDVKIATVPPPDWADAAAPTSVTVRRGAGVGGSDRVTVIWADGAIQKEWLQVTVKANLATLLASPDVFYFGNAVGDSGNSTTDTAVNTMDEMRARLDPHKSLLNPADIENPQDYNRSGVVSTMDEMIARLNNTTMLNDLNLITAP